ncbi:MAG: hypothetical protein RMK30_04705 [Anaerolineae bacterium]|nr:hypothetical protein [Anaerolineae bacterium]MDW8102157.1 hypothetical protein [Anaerolineae bacterium]
MEETEELLSRLEKALHELHLSLAKGELLPHEANYLLRKALSILELSPQKKISPSEISLTLDLAEKEREAFADFVTELGGRIAEAFREQGVGAELLRRVMEDLSKITLWLQSPEDFIKMGLPEGLRYFIKKTFEGLSVKIELQLENFPEKLPRLFALFLFRIFQGALLYAYQYARASRIEISSSKGQGFLSFHLYHDGLPFDERETRMFTALIPLHARVCALGGKMEIAANSLSILIPFAL